MKECNCSNPCGNRKLHTVASLKGSLSRLSSVQLFSEFICIALVSQNKHFQWAWFCIGSEVPSYLKCSRYLFGIPMAVHLNWMEVLLRKRHIGNPCQPLSSSTQLNSYSAFGLYPLTMGHDSFSLPWDSRSSPRHCGTPMRQAHNQTPPKPITDTIACTCFPNVPYVHARTYKSTYASR
jgi:hypothetical protein